MFDNMDSMWDAALDDAIDYEVQHRLNTPATDEGEEVDARIAKAIGALHKNRP